MKPDRYLWAFAVSTAALMAVYLALTLVVDPYGVSPLRFSREHLNLFKPARVAIDRYVKPYEVWRYQPKTVFLGSSRIQQGFDPSVLAESRFAPAYNSSVPASSLGLNVAYLRQYLDLDPQLKTVVFELFFYQFVKSQSGSFIDKGRDLNVFSDAAQLFLSRDALWASITTLRHNIITNAPVYEIKPGGHFFYPPGHDAAGTFASFPASIWKLHATRPTTDLDEDAFRSFQELVDLCRERKIELILLLTPNHVYDDFYIDGIGAWGKVEQWLTRVSGAAPIYSFSQPNAWVYEPVAPGMRYWNDPYHFTLEMGRNIMLSLAGEAPPSVPSDFLMKLAPADAAVHIEVRRKAVRAWIDNHADFKRKFEKERQIALSSR